MSNNRGPEHSRISVRLLIFIVLLLFPVSFFGFHAFIFLVWYYGHSDAIITAVWAPVFVLVFAKRNVRFLPEEVFRALLKPSSSSNDDREVPWPLSIKHRSILHPSSIVEVVAWWIVIAAIYWHLSSRFGFPESLKPHTLAIILVGYSAYFLAIVLAVPVAYVIASPVRRLVRELAIFKDAMRRIATVGIVLVVLDLVYTTLYRLMALYNPSAFSPQLKNFGDALYLSTSTITIFGGTEISPSSGTARVLLSTETVAGVFLIAALLAFVIAALRHEAWWGVLPTVR
jgi:hypothetical protein